MQKSIVVRTFVTCNGKGLFGWRKTLASGCNGIAQICAPRGFVPCRFWVPDTRRPGFAEECRRQSRLLRSDRHEAETLAWLEAVADTEGWE